MSGDEKKVNIDCDEYKIVWTTHATPTWQEPGTVCQSQLLIRPLSNCHVHNVIIITPSCCWSIDSRGCNTQTQLWHVLRKYHDSTQSHGNWLLLHCQMALDGRTYFLPRDAMRNAKYAVAWCLHLQLSHCVRYCVITAKCIFDILSPLRPNLPV